MRKILDSNNLMHTLIILLMGLLSFSSYTKSAKFPILILALFLTCTTQIIYRLAHTLKQVLWKEKTKVIQRIILMGLLIALCIRPIAPLFTHMNQVKTNDYWGIDNIYYASMANSISVIGDSESYLAQSGSKIEYHAGPVYLLVILERYLKIAPLDSIQILTLIFGIYIVLSLRQFFIFLYGPSINTLIAPMAAINLPFSKFHEDIRYFGRIVLDNLGFSFNMILGSLFGIAILCAFINLVLSRGLRSSLFIYLFTIICIFQIKPQYIPLLFVIIAIQIFRMHKGFGFRLAMATVSAIMMLMIYFSLSTYSSQESVEISFRIITPQSFLNSAPRIIFWSGPFIVMVLLLFFLFMKSLFKQKDIKQVLTPSLKFNLMLVALFIILNSLVLLIALDLTSPYNVLPDVSSIEGNDEQLLHPINLLVLTFLIYFVQSLPNISSLFIAGLTLIITLVSLLALLDALQKTSKQEDYVNLNPIAEVLQVLNTRDGIVLTNDFAYPGDNFRRSIQGDFLTVFSKNFFYFSGHSWFISSRDWSEKLEQNTRFYGSPLSQWHIKFLTQSKINFLLVSNRCESPIQSDLSKFTKTLYQNSQYSLYEVNRKISESNFPATSANIGQIRKYGKSDCGFSVVKEINKN